MPVTAPLPACEPASATVRRTPWWLGPHVLSLEAPVVAVLWQAALAHAHGVRLTPMLGAGLALACWVIYVLDRTLDTLGVADPATLDLRHAFYHRHRRVLLLGVVPPALLLLGWMALCVIPEGVLWQALGLALLVALYLAGWSSAASRVSRDVFVACAGLGGILLIARLPVGGGQRFMFSLLVLGAMVLSFLRQLDVHAGGVLPKESGAALLFAIGCTTSTRFFAMPETLAQPVAECLLLALLFACNLHGISRREAGVRPDAGHVRLVACAFLFTLGLLLCARQGGPLEPGLRGPAWAALGALGLYALLYATRRRWSVDAYRVLADVVLIVPLPLAWL
jgi:hypothetical protein